MYPCWKIKIQSIIQKYKSNKSEYKYFLKKYEQ